MCVMRLRALAILSLLSSFSSFAAIQGSDRIASESSVDSFRTLHLKPKPQHAESTLRLPAPFILKNRWGLRLTGLGGGYLSAVDNAANRSSADLARIDVMPANQKTISDYSKYLSAGWFVPIQLELTYAPVFNFELIFGGRYGFSGVCLNADPSLLDSFALALGGRYYFGAEERVRAYMGSQIAVNLLDYFRLDITSSVGFLFNLSRHIAFFVESHTNLAGLYNGDYDTGKGLQLTWGLGTGLHLRF